MTLNRRLRLLLLALGAALLVGAAALLGGWLAAASARDGAARQLELISLDLEALLERYETLPYALSFHPQAGALLRQADGATIQSFNQTLDAVAVQAKVAAIYLMDTRGVTIAASNWNTPQSYMGRNFGFRPYFIDALRGQAGRFYGIGSTTAEPGYFIAQPVYAGAHGVGQPAGVMAVKIKLDEVARAWAGIDGALALADRYGVVFLSNLADWQYKSLAPLAPDARREIDATLQYTGREIQPLRMPAQWIAPAMRPVGRLGWQLMLYPPHQAMLRSALLWGGAAALLLAMAAASAWAVHQRRRRLEERSAARAALQQAADELERAIAQRTGELLQANRSLEQKYAHLQETQHMLRSTQDELVQAGKLAMLGQMAAGVTHELNQPLTAIRAFADNAMTFLARGKAAEANTNLEHIGNAAGRMGAIIGQLKGFARKSGAEVAPVLLEEALRHAVLLLQADAQRGGVEIRVDARDRLTVLGDVVRIEQVLVNLLRNAVQAAEAAQDKTVEVLLLREGDEALVLIRDAGAGIPEEVAARLFEPFFTTREDGQGLGLGLAISSSIVQAMNGRLSAQNRPAPAHGAEFCLRLPLDKNGDDLVHA